MIFISHAAADRPVIDKFYKLLQTGCSLRQEEIYCTSIEGADVDTGEKFVDWIHEHLECSSLVVLFVTPNYLSSEFCLAEMGAAWALKKDVFPLVSPGVRRELDTVMLGRHTDQVDRTGLNNLFERISSTFPKVKQSVAYWDVEKDAYLQDFSRLFPELPEPQQVSREELQRTEDRLEAAMQINEKLRNQVSMLQEQVSLLEEAKDAEEVTSIQRRFSSEQERYETLTSQIYEELRGLDRVEVRCIYALVARSGWQPTSDTWHYWSSDIERAAQSDWIEITEYPDRQELQANRTHPRYKELFVSIAELDQFLTGDEISPDFIDGLEKQQRLVIDVRNQEYWEKELYREALLD
jgi:hypothetical protein